MAGREELYLKHIDENTGRIAKALEYIVNEDKKRQERQDKEREKVATMNEAISKPSFLPTFWPKKEEKSDDKNRT